MMCQPLQPPERPNFLPKDETLSEVSDEYPKVPREFEHDEAARLKMNRIKIARKRCAEHHKEAMQCYNAAMKDYEDELTHRHLEDEAERDHATNT
jgi:hypothetical protein